MASKHRVTVGEELRYDSDLQGLKNLSATYVPRSGGTSAAAAPLPFVNVRDFGASADMRTPTDTAISASSNTLSSAGSITFSSADVGKYVRVVGAGASGADLVTTIASYVSSSSVQLAASAATTVSAATSYIGSDNTAAFQAAVNALPVGGRVLFSGRYLLAGTINVTVPIAFEGSVSSQGSASQGAYLAAASATVSLFACSSDGVQFRNIAFFSVDTYTNVTAAATSTALTFNSGDYVRIENCRFQGWYKAVWFKNCAKWVISGCTFAACAQYNLHIQNVASPDAGDQVIQGCYFAAGAGFEPTAHIRYESGGGLKMTGNKFIGGTNHLDLAVADGVATSILLVSANSFENFTNSAIRLGQAGTTGTYSQVTITGNQFSGQRSGTNFHVQIGAGISAVNITGNDFHAAGNNSASYIAVNGGNLFNIDGNLMNTGASGINIGAVSGLDVKVGRGNKFRGISIPVTNSATFSTSGVDSIAQEYSRTFNGTTSAVSYSNFLRISPGGSNVTEVELTVYGRLVTAGGTQAVCAQMRRILSLPSTGGNVVVTTVGTDTLVGLMDVQFDVATSPTEVIIGVKRNSGDGGTSLSGFFRVVINGFCFKVTLQQNA